MGSEAYPTLTPDDAGASATSCLLQDYCDAWRQALRLVDVDYHSSVVPYHCPRFVPKYSEGKSQDYEPRYNLSMCYRAAADGWTAILQDRQRLQPELPLPEEDDA